MNRVTKFLSVAAFALLALPAIASAQWGGNGGYGYPNGGYGYPNGGYGNNGRYGGYGDMRSTVRDLKQLTRELQRHLDNDLDDSRYNGSRREDQLNDLARRFRNDVNGLSESNNSYDRRQDDRIRRVMDSASQLERALYRTRLDSHVQEIWSQIRNDLNRLGSYSSYDDYNNRNRRNNGTWRSGRNNLPSWWPF